MVGIQDKTWMCNKVVLKYQGKDYHCPIYDWVTTKEVTFTVGEGTSPSLLN